MLTNQPPVSSLIQKRRLKLFGHIARGCSLRGPLTCATSIHRSPPCWLAPPKRPTTSVLASNNRERSQTAQPWTSLCIAASNGSSFLATHRGNGCALRACHLMMMMMMLCWRAKWLLFWYTGEVNINFRGESRTTANKSESTIYNTVPSQSAIISANLMLWPHKSRIYLIHFHITLPTVMYKI